MGNGLLMANGASEAKGHSGSVAYGVAVSCPIAAVAPSP